MSDFIHHDASAGRSALLLVESLIHSLISRSVLTLDEAVQIVDIAAEADQGAALAIDGEAPPITLLTVIAASLRIDLKPRAER